MVPAVLNTTTVLEPQQIVLETVSIACNLRHMDGLLDQECGTTSTAKLSSKLAEILPGQLQG